MTSSLPKIAARIRVRSPFLLAAAVVALAGCTHGGDADVGHGDVAMTEGRPGSPEGVARARSFRPVTGGDLASLERSWRTEGPSAAAAPFDSLVLAKHATAQPPEMGHGTWRTTKGGASSAGVYVAILAPPSTIALTLAPLGPGGAAPSAADVISAPSFVVSDVAEDAVGRVVAIRLHEEVPAVPGTAAPAPFDLVQVTAGEGEAR